MEVVYIAREETELRSLPITAQCLAPHTLVDDSGEPLILRVDQSSEPGAYHVSFAISDQDYYFVVVVRIGTDGVPFAAWSYILPGIEVRLLVFSPDVEPSAISECLGIVPTFSCRSGETRPPRRIPEKDNLWALSATPSGPGTFDEKVGSLVTQLSAITHRFHELPPSCTVELDVAYEGWAGDWQFGGLSLSRGVLAFLKELGATFELSLYAHGPPMEEE